MFENVQKAEARKKKILNDIKCIWRNKFKFLTKADRSAQTNPNISHPTSTR